MCATTLAALCSPATPADRLGCCIGLRRARLPTSHPAKLAAPFRGRAARDQVSERAYALAQSILRIRPRETACLSRSLFIIAMLTCDGRACSIPARLCCLCRTRPSPRLPVLPFLSFHMSVVYQLCTTTMSPSSYIYISPSSSAHTPPPLSGRRHLPFICTILHSISHSGELSTAEAQARASAELQMRAICDGRGHRCTTGPQFDSGVAGARAGIGPHTDWLAHTRRSLGSRTPAPCTRYLGLPQRASGLGPAHPATAGSIILSRLRVVYIRAANRVPGFFY
jgi:hypothetical protein